jgi:hypothetical protein
VARALTRAIPAPTSNRSAIANVSGDPMSESTAVNDSNQFRERYEAVAAYYLESDCVEYVKSDSIAIYDRTDEFLTLIFDETNSKNLIGFKLKGFKNIFEQRLKHISQLRNIQFVDLVSAIETIFTDVGGKIMAEYDERREKAYKAAWELASNDNVRLSSDFLKA